MNTVRRPVDNGVETIRYLEFDDVPEGRVGVVADLEPRFQQARAQGHPNGAFDLVEVTLRTPDPEAAAARYETYFGRPQQLVRFVPGDDTAFVPYAIAVRDAAALPASTVDVLGARIEFRQG